MKFLLDALSHCKATKVSKERFNVVFEHVDVGASSGSDDVGTVLRVEIGALQMHDFVGDKVRLMICRIKLASFNINSTSNGLSNCN